MATPLKSKNTMMWRPDPVIEACRMHPNWAAFHRYCGMRGLFFDDIEKSGRGYKCLTFRYEEESGRFFRYEVTPGQGKCPQSACIDALQSAIEQGWEIPVQICRFFDEGVAHIRPPLPSIEEALKRMDGQADLDTLLGQPVATPSPTENFMDLIG